MSSCCPEAEFTFLEYGVQIRELNPQFDSSIVQFFPYRAIQSVRYAYSREDREGVISLWILGQGTPGAGGLSYRWRTGCGEKGKSLYETLISKLS